MKKTWLSWILILIMMLSITACAAPGPNNPAAGGSPTTTSEANQTSTAGPTTSNATNPATSTSSAGQVTQSSGESEFSRMLDYIPYSFLTEQDIWFSNPGLVRERIGMEGINSFSEVKNLPADKIKQLNEALAGLAKPGVGFGTYDLAKYVGFDGWMADRQVFPSYIPPRNYSFNEGEFDEELIGSRLTERGYQKVSYKNYTYYSKNGDLEFDMNDELARLGVKADLNRIAVLDDTVIKAPSTEILTGMLDALAGESISLMDNAGGQALADSLGDVLSGVIMLPERVANPAPGHTADWPPFDFTIPEDWGLLHEYELVGTGYKEAGQERIWVISLYYSDADAAAKDAATLVIRMKSYEFNTQYRDRESTSSSLAVTPLTDRFEVGEAMVQTYPGGATLTVECLFKPETGSAAWLTPTNTLRDLLFLVPDPAPYVKN